MRLTDKRGKYGNQKTVVNGEKLDSKREARRYADLLLLEKAGEIRGLQRQVRFDLVVNGIKICAYVADFTYQQGGETVIEDCKGYKTPVYRIKTSLMRACLGIEILES